MLMIHGLKVDNVSNDEIVHQRCLLLSGQCKSSDNSQDDFVSLEVTDAFGKPRGSGTTQNWPVVSGAWKALVMLSPGQNTIDINMHHSGKVLSFHSLRLNYLPLLQLPPLHLAIMVAKDSPLLIDCPPAKRGAISTAHSTLDAAILKFRMAAYMWQAMTAEDLRQKGLGRRSFRLEEEWGVDTTTCSALQTEPGSPVPTGLTAKIHIVRSEKTLAELRDASVAQQNSHGRNRDALHTFFEDALKAHGSPFVSSERPVVAGLILDSHYSVNQHLILAHAALGCHKPDGISLGVFGSHTTYAWPRFMEEIPACLLDTTPTGDSVGNDNGECGTMREACFVGQGAFLHEVGHAFAADHTTGIMARGYSKHWGKNFLAASDDESSNDAKWDIEDVLRFRNFPHFKLPGDAPTDANAPVNISCALDKDEELTLEIVCEAGIAQIIFNPELDSTVVMDFRQPFESSKCKIQGASFDGRRFLVSVANLRARFDGKDKLGIFVLGMNGKKRTCTDAGLLLADLPFIKIPGSSLVLRKQSVKSDGLNVDSSQFCSWAMLLQRKMANGQLDPVSAIDLRVGCTMDGAVVYYQSGAHANCGPVTTPEGRPHEFGGHASEKKSIPAGAKITKVEINSMGSGWGSLNGIRMTLDDGTEWGELNETEATDVLQPDDGEEIVGFYGVSDRPDGFTFEFGIITAPKGFQLPEICYEMPELQSRDEEPDLARPSKLLRRR
ncbi:putative peptidase family-domain-containing protein [Xylariales sp. PMI_506]|nr:putative peptidase family-domain-containing protein [Xylariales sp. PMI_506]